MIGTAYLLDTQLVIWALDEADDLPARYRDILESDARKVVSTVSFWEIAIKRSIGRLRIRGSYAQAILDSEAEILPIVYLHALQTERLPRLHGDPFDRMLVAQAQLEGLTILSTDRLIHAYDVAVI